MDHRFQKGQSGNPAGRPRSARNKRKLLEEALVAAAASRIAGDIARRAGAGEVAALAVLARWKRLRMREAT